MQTWEILVLELLGWDLSIVTPYCILDQVLRRIDPEPHLRLDLSSIREAAETLLHVVTTEFQLYRSMTSDVIALSCLLAAFNGMKGVRGAEQQLFIQDLTTTLSQIAGVPEVELARCQYVIAKFVQGAMVESSGESTAVSAPKYAKLEVQVQTSPSNNNNNSGEHNTTPTDLMDISVC